VPQAKIAHISRKGKQPLIEAIYVLVPHSHVRLPLASLPIYQMARGASSPKRVSPRSKSTDWRLPFTISFEPVSCTLAPQPKHAENRSVKLLLSTPKRSKNFIFLLFYANKFSAFGGFIALPSYIPRTPFCYKTLALWNFMRQDGQNLIKFYKSAADKFHIRTPPG